MGAVSPVVSQAVEDSVVAAKEVALVVDQAVLGEEEALVVQAEDLAGPEQTASEGVFFENLRDSVFDARQFSFSGLEQTKPSYIQNNFGAFLGGPFSIPHLYNGKDRSSFFVGYTGSRNLSPFDSTVTVPTQAERLGDFSQTVGRVGGITQPVDVYDPTDSDRASVSSTVPQRDHSGSAYRPDCSRVARLHPSA